MSYSEPVHVSKRRWDYLPEFASEQLPRYTSYPPANRFVESIDEAAVQAALLGLPGDSTLSLYVHVPFCRKLCWYCGCNTGVPTAANPVDAYVDALVREIDMRAASTNVSAQVARVHFGGGSPDILTPKQIQRLFSALRGSFTFARFPEIAAELDPRGLSPAIVEAYVEAGLTRASLGVQVLDHGVQQRINRVQPVEMIERGIRWLREAGVVGINTDLMYGLPGQTISHVVEAATFAAIQDVDRIAVFGYAHVPWMKKHQKAIDPADLPGGELRFRQAEAAARTLEQAGYLPIGFDHFAAPGDPLAAASMQGRLHRNFQGYTDDDSAALIGFGASAISSLPDLIFQNGPDTAFYRDALAAGRSPVVRGVTLSPQDKKVGKTIERLLCDFEARLAPDLLTAARARLAPMIAAGLAQLNGAQLTVTSRGQPYVRSIAACVDPQFAPRTNVHSLAI